ncbi:MAG: hypothetical protein AB7L41_03155 [Flavobacteriaceae bacterium]
MTLFTKIFARRRASGTNTNTVFARRRFALSNPGETAACAAARYGCIAQ